MDERPYTPDPNALTQPIPVVQVAPPPRPIKAPTVAPASYVHRFGNVPWYLFGRLAAFVLDYLAVPFVVATFGFHVIERGFILFAGHDEAGFATLATASFVFASIFAFICEAAFGTTLGKLVFALQVRRRDGRHAGAGRVFARALLLPIDIVVIGPLLARVTPRHQRLGDMLAGTVVGGSRIGA
ncbi:MAG: RDD family protein, partial [Candidatus Eremiobacteraeota bacterium]|nr:RDD family protein [Candidatus Eremiobacteraeota bacterium]